MQQTDTVLIGYGYCYQRCADLAFYATHESSSHRVVGIYCQWIANHETGELAYQTLYGEPTICRLDD